MLVFMGVGPRRASGVTPCWAAMEFNKYMHASQREDFSHALMMAPRNSCDQTHRLQTFGNPTASSTLSKSLSDNYHRDENLSLLGFTQHLYLLYSLYKYRQFVLLHPPFTIAYYGCDAAEIFRHIHRFPVVYNWPRKSWSPWSATGFSYQLSHITDHMSGGQNYLVAKDMANVGGPKVYTSMLRVCLKMLYR